MHLLDCYSLNCGLKINKPFIFDKFFPLNVERFITFSPEGLFQSRTYDYWSEVTRILLPYLKKNDITMLQLGSAESLKYEGCINLCGQTTDNQMFYLINNSMLHLGVDGFANHLASHAGKKIVSLFSDSDPKNDGPYFSKSEDVRLLSADLEGKGRSYSTEENPKSINKIKPEKVAEEVCDLLGIEFDYGYETVYIGDDFHTRRVEYVPNEKGVDISSLSIDSIVVRMDLNFDEQSLSNQLQGSPCSIVTKEPISPNLLNYFKSRVTQFIYVLNEKSSKQYVQDLFDIGIECLLMSEETDEKILEEFKFKFLDFGQIHTRYKVKSSDLDFLDEIDLDNLYYRSNKFLIKSADIFYGEAAYRENKSVEILGDITLQKVIDSKEFWKESENYIFFLKK